MEYHQIFNELKTKLCNGLQEKPLFIDKIQKAQDIDELIQIMQNGDQFSISQIDLLNALKIIMEWSLNMFGNKVKNLNFKDTDSKSNINNLAQMVKNLQHDLKHTLPHNKFSTPQIIQEIHKLARGRTRNVQLLNTYFQNIINNHKYLSITSCSTLLYCMGCLSYSDERLLKNITEHITSHTDISSKACKSILKSMATIRYKNDRCLEHICKQIFDGKIKCDSNEIVNILQSFAMLDYYSTYVQKIIKEYIPYDKFVNLTSNNKLSFTWSCTIFKVLEDSFAKSVLNENFVSMLVGQGEKENITNKLKLLNINAYAKYMLKNYSGPFLVNEQCPIIKTKYLAKQSYLNILESTLKHILPSVFHFKMNVDTKMGFYIDAELGVNSNFNFVDIRNIEDNQKFTKYASLYFCCAIEQNDNELLTLEIIHRYVELLDKYFGSVCELDIIFNFEKAYFILDELLVGGEIQETSKKNVLKAIAAQDLLQEVSYGDVPIEL
ncbi:AP-1 complex subunit sigma-2 [Eufriesea mexicana]|uniref:AP-1 complex subunit sigma-2 n=1 Tax=Eufriesea mexicana TaxID=516756 RepID=A0A310S4Q5_9HYME|nr:AP-1 complex subunit sigma-2 [Eufriesea mexicana]